MLVFWLRFDHLPGTGFWDSFVEALVFLPMGLLSLIVLFFLHEISTTARQKKLVWAGYAIAIIPAFYSSLAGGLFFAPPYWAMLGTFLFGGVPLILVTLSFFMIGRKG